MLSDNGAVFTASFRGDRGALSTELARLGIVFKHSRPYHPQTCGRSNASQRWIDVSMTIDANWTTYELGGGV